MIASLFIIIPNIIILIISKILLIKFVSKLWKDGLVHKNFKINYSLHIIITLLYILSAIINNITYFLNYNLNIINLIIYSEIVLLFCNIMLYYNIIGIQVERFIAVAFVRKYENTKCFAPIFIYHAFMIFLLIFSLIMLDSWNFNPIIIYRILYLILEVIGIILHITMYCIYKYYVDRLHKYCSNAKRYLSTRYQGKENIDTIGGLLKPLNYFFLIGIIYSFCTIFLPIIITIIPLINLSFSMFIGFQTILPPYILLKEYKKNLIIKSHHKKYKKNKVVPEMSMTGERQFTIVDNINECGLHFKYLNNFWEDAYKLKNDIK
uniref:7TM GPCR serpentine receptor class x (Srx) domain-containing protein n=1 Tax=Strongyloides stercoralis TaxID=6248 RepID=A0A0K0ERW1_STRER